VIPVTKCFLPPLEEYSAQIRRAFHNGWLTNRGELVLELEQKLSDYLRLDASRILLMNNGTTPLQIALKLLGKGGEVITTPFSYVATTAAIVWEGCTPVFVDIHPEYLTIDHTQIEGAITDRTTCILATHVFGNPCNVEEIGRIAHRHDLKVIYDGAHAFGVRYKGRSLFEYGDISTCSFHATKLFHTGEGGALFCGDPELFDRCFHSHNFGHDGPLAFHGLGINGKMSELNAAMGLSVLPHVPDILESRREAVAYYNEHLPRELRRLRVLEETAWNHGYFPVLFDSERSLLRAESGLVDKGIVPRRYFHPSLNRLPYVAPSRMPVSEAVASSVLCLPLFANMKPSDLAEICDTVRSTSLSSA